MRTSEKRAEDKKIDAIIKKLGDYKCEGQMNIFDIDWDALYNLHSEESKEAPEEPDQELFG